jgi:hypothetical protein
VYIVNLSILSILLTLEPGYDNPPGPGYHNPPLHRPIKHAHHASSAEADPSAGKLRLLPRLLH